MGRIEYVYLLEHVSSGRLYLGCSYKKNCHPSQLWASYFTSSKIVKAIIEEEGLESFVIKKIIECTDGEACKLETQLLTEIDAKNNPNWLNMTNGDSNFKNKGGYKLSDETKRKISVSNTGKTNIISDETKRKISEKLKGRKSPMKGKDPWNKGKPGSQHHTKETKEKMSNARKGIQKSEQMRQRNSAAQKGVPKSEAAIASMKLAAQNRAKGECTKCGKYMDLSNLKRYHNDNCKVSIID